MFLRRRQVLFAFFVMVFLGWGVPSLVFGAGASEVFFIGEPDGASAGFGLSEESYRPYAERYREPVEFTVGKSSIEEWPFIHPSSHDQWAGGKSHTFTIHFSVEELPATDVYLHVGLVDTWVPSLMTVSCNDQKIGSQRVPKGTESDALAFDPMGSGKPVTVTFVLKKDLFSEGANTIKITLDDGSWVIYDYVQLSHDANQPKLKARPEPELKKDMLAGPMAGHSEIVFACRQLGSDGHWYANFGYYAESTERKAYRAMGRLCKLDAATGEVTVLLRDDEGSIRDPQVHYDGKRIVFSYRKASSENFHLYEIGADGSGLRQLTDGAYDDIEPAYLPDGGIVFCSSRCKRWVNCWLTQVAVLYRCDADGGNIEQLSSNNEHENTPWPLADGRILYQRWEYIDRSQVHYHHLWTCRPDGTEQMVYYGNMHPGTVMIDAKPIPGSDSVVAVFSPGHGKREHEGVITIVSPKAGPDRQGSARTVSRGDNFRDPYPVSSEYFLVAQGDRLVVMDQRGRMEDIYKLPKELADAGVQCHEPRVLRAREREHVIPRSVDAGKSTGVLILDNVYRGRNMEGVRRGEIAKLLVLESLPMPIHYTGGMDPISYGGTFTLERILGTVPVEADGSAYMEVPADRSLFFVALDGQNRSVKRMQSFLTVRPGGTRSCIGCHEHRTEAPKNPGKNFLMALKRAPSRIEKIDGIPEVFDFPRDIQPILDKHCVECHGYDKHAGGVILTGDRGPMFSHSYYTLTYLREFVDGRNDPKSNLPPRSIGTSASPLMEKISGEHYEVKLSANEIERIGYWIESGAAYPGTYAALGSGMIGGYNENMQNNDGRGAEAKAAAEAIGRQCSSCHKDNMVLPRTLWDERDISFWRPDTEDYRSRLRMSRHRVFNLTRPAKSLMLLAPLAKEAGGYGMCKVQDEQAGVEEAVFAGVDDADYRKILAMCTAGKEHLEGIKRFDMPGFRPPEPYIREMKRYGILPVDLGSDAQIDVYATDRAYWQSLWYKPAGN